MPHPQKGDPDDRDMHMPGREPQPMMEEQAHWQQMQGGLQPMSQALEPGLDPGLAQQGLGPPVQVPTP